MKIEYKILILAFCIGLLGWVIDALISQHLFYHDSFLHILLRPPPHEYYPRVIFLVSVLVFGYVISHVMAQREKARQEVESLAKFPRENISPVLRLDGSGMIRFANAASDVVLREWDVQVGHLAPEFWRKWVTQTIAAGDPRSVDAVFGGRTYNLTIVPVPDSNYANLYGSDITQRRAAEIALRQAHDILEVRVGERTAELQAANQLLLEAQNRTKTINALLRLYVEKTSRRDYIDAVVRLLADWSKCRNVGIRILNDQGCIPYEATTGFSDEFLKLENEISIHTDQCACIRILQGSFKPQERSEITPFGSFATNDSLGFLDRLTETEKTDYRGQCIASGFSSLAIVPIRYQDKILAAIHLADPESGKVTPQVVDFVESTASVIGEAIHRFTVEEELQRASSTLVERSKMLEAFFQHSLTPLVFLDRDFNFIRVNEAYARSCQRKIADFVGHNHFEDYPSPELQERFTRVVAARKPYRVMARPFEFPDHPDWGVSYWDLTLFPVLDESGEVDFLVFSLLDVTDHIIAEKKLEEQAALLELAHDAILVRSIDDTISFWNRGAEETYGWTQDEVMGMPIYGLLQTEFPVPPEVIEAHLLEKGEWEGEVVHTRNDGRKITVNSRWAVQYDLQGKPIGFLEINRDITARKIAEDELRRHRDHLEQLVQERSAELVQLNQQLQGEVAERKETEEKLKEAVTELSRSNEELEQFAYVASHDLQEPLRMVSSFVTLLAKRYQGELDADADDFIKFAVDGANRMQQLIKDLLDYSRVGTQGRSFQPFSLQKALDVALANLKITIQETGAIITCDPLPVINGDEPQFVQLFQNLIDNGIKFRDAEIPRIHISAQWNDNNWTFTLSDNGIGIDPKQKDRIFLIFQRLHVDKKYPGTGIGLAICKKIVERHGGKIWMEPGVDKGTVFHFTVT
jgi:PAS domain S-box-containing protein